MITEKEKQEIADMVYERMKNENRSYKKEKFFVETESVLRSYSYNKIIINKNNERIQDIIKNGLKDEKVISNIERVQGGLKEYKGLPEKEFEKIQFLENENLKLEKRIIRVENALECVKNDRYYPIIEKRYFYNWIWEDIEEELNINRKTLIKQNSRLINTISNYIFPEWIYKEGTLFK